MTATSQTQDARIVTIELPRPGGQSILSASDEFVHRHIGPDAAETQAMLDTIGCASLEALIDETIPSSIRLKRELALGEPRGEYELIEELRQISLRNKVFRSFIGMGYNATITPPVIQRNILENPGWYTQYTPYQAEISQGRLEALLNFQTMVADLTGLPLANASMLDEATSAAEAMAMCHAITGRNRFFVSDTCYPQTIEVVRTRGKSMGIEITVGALDAIDPDDLAGVLVQYPNTNGAIVDYSDIVKQVHDAGGLVVVAADILALTLLTPPGEFGADIAVGSTQRFGVPMGFGGPHAAFLATKEQYARKIPGRLVGVSRDAEGRMALRLAIQTREQHIKRDRATSNICTAQVLLAIIASMYAVYHGPSGLRRIAERIHAFTCALGTGLRRLGHDVKDGPFFDSVKVTPNGATVERILRAARDLKINLRKYEDGAIGIALDEVTTRTDIENILKAFGRTDDAESIDELLDDSQTTYPEAFARQSAYLTHEAFNTHHSETDLLRYMTYLQSRDLSLANSMIPLGSCTMKLNGTSEMIPITWPEFARLHPFAPAEQTEGYAELFRTLEQWLAEITGFEAVSLQPNAGSQGEYAGLLVIRAYHESRGDKNRRVCLIPVSAHGTNPASAVIAGFKVVPVACDDKGNIDIADLEAKAKQHAARLGALMITYPSTHGVFESQIERFCEIIHEHGGQVYLDGANMNAMVGLCRPGDFGADVCHLNLHKTFCIPHGGGGPGMGPIGVAKQLAPFLPTHPVRAPANASKQAIGPVSAAPYGSPSILPISWTYIALMGAAGLKRASQIAVLNANYMAKRLEAHYDILYRGRNGRVAHEFIIDCRPFDRSAGIKIDDIAKRLIDYGFHAPTMSWPVAGTLMIEPTESESRPELDRLCDALIHIREEIRAIENSEADREDNVLKQAPHTIEMLTRDAWQHAYSREAAAFPAPWLRHHKFWSPVRRVDNPYGDRNLTCTCPPMESYSAER